MAAPQVALQTPLRGKFLRRYKRFFVDIETEAGEELTVYCPDPGSMRSIAHPGAAVRCSVSDNPKRKLRHTLEMIRAGGGWVGVNPLLANSFVEQVLRASDFQPLGGYARCRREVSVGEGSRLDFLLGDHPDDPRPTYVEVKSVTFAEPRGERLAGRFPDSVTKRGTRHLEVLTRLAREGARACMLFLVQRGDCDYVEPARDIDPDYAAALQCAHNQGVELFALQAQVHPDGLHLAGELPVYPNGG